MTSNELFIAFCKEQCFKQNGSFFTNDHRSVWYNGSWFYIYYPFCTYAYASAWMEKDGEKDANYKKFANDWYTGAVRVWDIDEFNAEISKACQPLIDAGYGRRGDASDVHFVNYKAGVRIQFHRPFAGTVSPVDYEIYTRRDNGKYGYHKKVATLEEVVSTVKTLAGAPAKPRSAVNRDLSAKVNDDYSFNDTEVVNNSQITKIDGHKLVYRMKHHFYDVNSINNASEFFFLLECIVNGNSKLIVVDFDATKYAQVSRLKDKYFKANSTFTLSVSDLKMIQAYIKHCVRF